MAERWPKLVAALAVVAGLAVIGVGLSVFVEAWQTSRAWAGSAEALHAEPPAETPIWLDSPADSVVEEPPTASPTAALDAVIARPSPTILATGAEATTGPHATLTPGVSDGVTREGGQPDPPMSLASPGEVEIAEADFRFLDPPEPGAHARLALTIQSHADRSTGPLMLVLSTRWLQSFQVLGAIPPVLDDRPGGDGERQFVFPGLGPGERQTVELHVIASAEEIDGPAVRVLLGDGRGNDATDGAEIGRAQPRTVAPRPRPGPARAISIPKLDVRAGVVPVAWEPPPYVVGQLQGTAAVSQGNTVLVGHLRGAAGDVFARLDRLRPGDEVVAESRGLEYRFLVSEIAVLPYDDIHETQPTSTPRLTMMTCTGIWNFARQDYSHRLWVVAEPPELAQETIKANAEKAAAEARAAESAAAARAIHEAESQGTPAADVQTPQPVEAAPPSTPLPDPPAIALSQTTPLPAAVGQANEATSGESLAPSAEAVAPLATARPDAMSAAPGLSIESPTEGAAVPSHLRVRGRRSADAPPGQSLWLVVKADVPGSHWYALDHPLDVQADGTWAATIDLGGAAGVHHELRVGVADAAIDASLRRHFAEHTGQPLDDLPPGLRIGARVTVERR